MTKLRFPTEDLRDAHLLGLFVNGKTSKEAGVSDYYINKLISRGFLAYEKEVTKSRGRPRHIYAPTILGQEFLRQYKTEPEEVSIPEPIPEENVT